jgi:alpha-L-fucosidase
MHVHAWPGDTAVIAGLLVGVKSARLLATGQPVGFEQDKLRVRLTGLPGRAPDAPVTTVAIECDAEPRQDQIVVRNQRERLRA